MNNDTAKSGPESQECQCAACDMIRRPLLDVIEDLQVRNVAQLGFLAGRTEALKQRDAALNENAKLKSALEEADKREVIAKEREALRIHQIHDLINEVVSLEVDNFEHEDDRNAWRDRARESDEKIIELQKQQKQFDTAIARWRNTAIKRVGQIDEAIAVLKK